MWPFDGLGVLELYSFTNSKGQLLKAISLWLIYLHLVGFLFVSFSFMNIPYLYLFCRRLHLVGRLKNKKDEIRIMVRIIVIPWVVCNRNREFKRWVIVFLYNYYIIYFYYLILIIIKDNINIALIKKNENNVFFFEKKDVIW